MINMLEKVYFASPTPLQNIFVSLYGKKIWSKRYGSNIGGLLQEIEQTRSLSAEETENLRLQKVKKILAYAYAEIPYYRRLFNTHSVSPEDITCLEDLEKIPPLEKETLRSHPDQFFPVDWKKKSYVVQKTSGSTGTPLEVHVDKRTYRLAMALLVAHEHQYGVNLGERRATFAGRMIQPVDNMKPPFWRFNSAENQMLFSSYHLNQNTFPFYLSELNTFKPLEIIGYPSAIYSFACLVQEAGESLGFVPQIIVTNSETLFDWQRETIEDVFACKVADYYGTSEYVVFAGQCRENNYHINPLLGELEVVNQDGHRIYGESGDILCTTFSNYAMPLIRYRVGDVGVVSKEPCNCGCNQQSLSSVEGRIDDVIVTKDGRHIGRIDHIFKGVHGVKECQVVQNDYADFTLNLVKGAGFQRRDIVAIQENLKERIGTELVITVNYLSDIPRTSRGKFKGVIGIKAR